MIGIIINQAEEEKIGELRKTLTKIFPPQEYALGVIPHNAKLSSPRVAEIAQQLQAKVLYGQHRLDSLASNFLVVAMQMQNALERLKELISPKQDDHPYPETALKISPRNGEITHRTDRE